jgi:hypothetical protein
MANFRIPNDSNLLLQILRGVKERNKRKLTRYTRIREGGVLGSNLARNTDNTYAFRGFP